MKKWLKWGAVGFVGLLVVLFVIGTVGGDDDRLQSTKGIAAMAPLQDAIQNRDVVFARFTCDESERILSKSANTTPELEDWGLLAPVCNQALDGKWDEAMTRLEAVTP